MIANMLTIGLVLAFAGQLAWGAQYCYVCTAMGARSACETTPDRVVEGPRYINCSAPYCTVMKVVYKESGETQSFARLCETTDRKNLCVHDPQFVTCYNTCSESFCNKDNPDHRSMPSQAAEAPPPEVRQRNQKIFMPFGTMEETMHGRGNKDNEIDSHNKEMPVKEEEKKMKKTKKEKEKGDINEGKNGIHIRGNGRFGNGDNHKRIKGMSERHRTGGGLRGTAINCQAAIKIVTCAFFSSFLLSGLTTAM